MWRPRAESNRQRGVTKYTRIKRTQFPRSERRCANAHPPRPCAVSTLTSRQRRASMKKFSHTETQWRGGESNPAA